MLVGKIYNTKFLIFLILSLIISVGYSLINEFYLKPRALKSELIKIIKTDNDLKVSDKQLVQFSDCLCNKLINIYKRVDNIPKWKDYGLVEKKLALNCIIDNLIADTNQKQIILRNYDTIIVKMWGKLKE